MSRTIMITGGYGFIGTNFIRYWLSNYPKDRIINVDCGTYASRPTFLDSFLEAEQVGSLRVVQFSYTWESIDIRDHAAVARLMTKYRPEHVIHFAAESHVCRSIAGPKAFMQTNIMGTFHLLEEFRNLWGEQKNHKFIHISTDEVFGELGMNENDLQQRFDELWPLKPRSPYAASKAASDHIVQAYHHTYGMETIITNCTNNFGRNQHPEKLVPKTILSLLRGEQPTIYGSGLQIRDWLYVDNHCSAIDLLFHEGTPAFRYCIGGEREMHNMDLALMIQDMMLATGMIQSKCEFKQTNDRPTDDQRYAVDPSLLQMRGWDSGSKDFEENLMRTISWYREQYNLGHF